MSYEEIVRGGVSLPCSSPRNCREKFLKLLSHVDPHAAHGFGFEGVFLRPGATVTDAQLRPGPEYPPTPVALEYMRGSVHGIPGHRRAESIYILWRYDRDHGSWRELGRAVSFAWEWAVVLRPLAVRAMREARGTNVEIMPDLPAIAGRIAAVLDRELKSLEPPHRHQVLGVLHDQFGARLCA